MPKSAANNVISDAQKIVEVWTANPTFSMGDVTLATFSAAIESLTTADATVEAKRVELKGLIDGRDDQTKTVTDLVTRARSGIRATFGSDSAQYDQAGGTRKSERKKPVRKPAA